MKKHLTQPMVFVGDCLLLFLSAMLGSGCVPTKVIRSFDAASLPQLRYHAYTNGITLAFAPVTSPEQVEKLFGVNLLDVRTPNMVPVLVAVTNDSSGTSIVVGPEQFNLLHGEQQSPGGQVRNVKERVPSAAERIVTPGVGLVGYLFFAAPADSWYQRAEEVPDPVNANLRQVGLDRKTLSPGRGTLGYVYFILPKKGERLPPWALAFAPLDLHSDQTIQMVTPFDWETGTLKVKP